MSSTSEQVALPAKAGLSRDARVIALVAMAHFTSHIHIMLLPPIFGQVKDAFGVSYIEIGLALTAFNVCSAMLQTPAGFLVDRIGPRLMLTAGLIVGSAAIAAAALLPGYWFFVIAYGLMGVANTVYHPADYSILSATVDYRLLVIVAGGVLPRVVRKPLGPSKTAPARSEAKVGLDLLLSAPILRNLLFFFCLAMANGGIQTFTVVGLGAIHGTPASAANIALSGFLLFSAGGVLLVGIMSLGGLLNGIIQPSRDMMVRAVTPAGSFGKVFGFVTTGFNFGGVISPLLYAWLMDRGEP